MQSDFFADEGLVGTWEDKFIAVDFDFATLLSSPFCSRILFAIVQVQLIMLEFSAQQVELKWLMLNKWRWWFHSSRVKLLFVNMSANWCLVSTYLIWIFWVQIDSIKHPIKSNSVGSGYVSHCWTSAFDDHFNHGFIVLKHIQQHSIGTIMCSAWWNAINIGQIEIGVRGWNLFSHVKLSVFRQVSPWLSYIFGFVEWNTSITKSLFKNIEHFLEIAGLARDSCHGKQRVSPFYHGSESCFQGLKQSDPQIKTGNPV